MNNSFQSTGSKVILSLVLTLISVTPVCAQEEQPVQEKPLHISVQLLEHGETRNGGLHTEEEESSTSIKSNFLTSRTRLKADYQKEGLQANVTAQHNAIWGQKDGGSISVYEAWAKFTTKNGLFAQIGRQALTYDDERIIGPNDWAMASQSHDVLRMGYEAHGHKAHAILAYNQNPENVNGGSFYKDGAQPYKTMQTLWYHYDVKNIPFGGSLLFMNIGMQGGDPTSAQAPPSTIYQQLWGTYLSYKPEHWSANFSYYRQGGKSEDGIKIDAWMLNVGSTLNLTAQFTLSAGYDYLSGDHDFAVPPKGNMGLTRHQTIKGFNSVYGSHHKFYGMMDFFYVSTYVGGFTPGLQNLYAGTNWKPMEKLSLTAKYHYLATATHLEGKDMTLGHDIELEASYQPSKSIGLSAGFSYMTGTKTMEQLKRADNKGSLLWGWISLAITPFDN